MMINFAAGVDETGRGHMEEMNEKATQCKHVVSLLTYYTPRYILIERRKSFPCKKCGKEVKESKTIRILSIILCLLSRLMILATSLILILVEGMSRGLRLFVLLAGLGSGILMDVVRIIIGSKCTWTELSCDEVVQQGNDS